MIWEQREDFQYMKNIFSPPFRYLLCDNVPNAPLPYGNICIHHDNAEEWTIKTTIDYMPSQEYIETIALKFRVTGVLEGSRNATNVYTVRIKMGLE